jgi:hypothetical protein
VGQDVPPGRGGGERGDALPAPAAQQQRGGVAGR